MNAIYNFDLDVCAVPETSKCINFFTPEIDGLSQNWDGCCWMNPPYGREQIKWIEKAYEETKKNNTTKVMCLIPARPDTKVWHETIFPNAIAICFIKGRLKFCDGESGAPFPSALVLFSNAISEDEKLVLESLGKLIL